MILSYSLGPPFVTPYALTLNRLSLLRGVCVCVCVVSVGKEPKGLGDEEFTGKKKNTHTAHHLRRIDPTLYTIRRHSKKKNAFFLKAMEYYKCTYTPPKKSDWATNNNKSAKLFRHFPPISFLFPSVISPPNKSQCSIRCARSDVLKWLPAASQLFKCDVVDAVPPPFFPLPCTVVVHTRFPPSVCASFTI